MYSNLSHKHLNKMAKKSAKNTQKDEFLNDLANTPASHTPEPAGTAVVDDFENINAKVNIFSDYSAEPEGDQVVTGSKFWEWRDKNDNGFIGKVFVGQYIAVHKDDSEDALPNDILGYDFKGADGETWILGSNHSLAKALDEIDKATGKPLKDLQPAAWFWIKLLSVDKAKKGSFNRFKIIRMATPPKGH